MDNVTFQDIPNGINGEVTTFAIIDNGNGSFTSMPKTTYEATLAANSAPQANSTES